jgi:hypothetical protein
MRRPTMLAAALAGAGVATAAGTASTGQDALSAEISTWRWTVDQILFQQRDPPERQLETVRATPSAGAVSASNAQADNS